MDKSTVILWVKAFHATGKQAAAPMGGRRRFALLGERDWLLARVAAAPDLTERALRAELAARGTKVSYDAVWRFLRQERLTFKKSRSAKLAGKRLVPAWLGRRPDRAGSGCAALLRTERQWRALNAVLGLLLVASIIPMWKE